MECSSMVGLHPTHQPLGRASLGHGSDPILGPGDCDRSVVVDRALGAVGSQGAMGMVCVCVWKSRLGRTEGGRHTIRSLNRADTIRARLRLVRRTPHTHCGRERWHEDIDKHVMTETREELFWQTPKDNSAHDSLELQLPDRVLRLSRAHIAPSEDVATGMVGDSGSR